MTFEEIRISSANAGAWQRGYLLMTLVRPLAPYLAWVALRLHLKPRHVTYLSFMLAWVMLALAMAGGARGRLLALALLLVWEALDVTDGTMARALAMRDNFGGFLDYAGGIVLVAFLPLALGIGLYAAPEGSLMKVGLALPPAAVLIAGAVISVVSLLMRLVNRVLFLRFGSSYSKWDEGETWPPRSLTEVVEVGIRNLETLGGLQAIVLLAAAFAGVLELAIAGYFVFYLVLFVVFAITTHRNYRERYDYSEVLVRPRAR